jgi:DNA-binding transcriptional ArsR family regulator
MSDIGFVGPDRSVAVEFHVAPTHNALATICMFAQHHLDSISDWIDKTVAVLPADLKGDADFGCRALHYVDNGEAPFPEFLDDLEAADPQELVAGDLDRLIAKAGRTLGVDAVPDRDALAADPTVYRALIKRLMEKAGMDFQQDEADRGFAAVRNPHAYHRSLVSYLRRMWTQYLAPEWERARPMIEESVRAFRTVAVPTATAEAAVKRVTGRETLPDDWYPELAEANRVIFIPSVHIGPYMMALPRQGNTLRYIVSARIPEGSTVRSRRLERSELLTRLTALSDETRMQILELVAERGSLTSLEVMEELGLTQSSASRHLTQLSATGLLSKDASQKTKVYRLGSKRLDEVLASLRGILDPENAKE